jgi:hypothetical protein
LSDLADIYEILWQGDTSIAAALKQIYPSQTATIDNLLSVLEQTKDLPLIGSYASQALSKLNAPLTQSQIVNGFTIDLGSGQKLTLAALAQLVDAAIQGQNLDIDEITKAVNDTIEAGQLVVDLVDATTDLINYAKNTDPAKLTGVQAIDNYVQTLSNKYAAVDSSLNAIALARTQGNQVLSDDSYLRTIAAQLAETAGIDLADGVAGVGQLLAAVLSSELRQSGVDDEAQAKLAELLLQLGGTIAQSPQYSELLDKLSSVKFADIIASSAQINQWLRQVANYSSTIADQAAKIGVDNLTDLKNYLAGQIDSAQQRLVDWVAANKDPLMAELKSAAARAINQQLSQLRAAILNSSTYADILGLVDIVKQATATIDSIINTAISDYQVVRPVVEQALDFAQYLRDFDDQARTVDSLPSAVALARQLADGYSALHQQFATLENLSPTAQSVANWALSYADDVLLGALPRLENLLLKHAHIATSDPFLSQLIDNFLADSISAALSDVKTALQSGDQPTIDSLISLSSQLDTIIQQLADLIDRVVDFITNHAIVEFDGDDALVLSETSATSQLTARYSDDFLALIDDVNQTLGQLGNFDLPQIELPPLALQPINLSGYLAFSASTLSTTVDFANLTDDIAIANQKFELSIPKRLSEAFERIGIKLGVKTYSVKIAMPRCAVDGKSNLNSHSANCKIDAPVDNSGGNGGGGSAPAGLTTSNLPTTTYRTSYRGLTSDTESDTPPAATTAEDTSAPKSTDPQGEFISLPIKRADWSLLSVVLTLLILVIAVVKLLGLRDHFTDKANAIFRILTIVPTTAAIVVLIMLNDFSTPMLLFNVNTLPIIGIAIIQTVLAVKSPHSDED